MASTTFQNKHRNPSPPPPECFKFEISDLKKQIFTAFGDKCIFMDQIDEEIFDIPWVEETSSSSEEEEVSIIETPKQNSKEKKTVTPPKIKHEISLSDDEAPSRHRKKEKKSRRSPKPKKRYDKRYSDSEYSDEEDEPRYRERSRRDIKPVKYEETEDKKPMAGITPNFDTYICEVCNIVLNSEVTMQTHMIGKRHMKALKAKAIPEVAMQSLSAVQHERDTMRDTTRDTMRDTTRDTVTADRFPKPPPGVKRINLDEDSYIQEVAEKYRKGPVPGLSKVIEIRHIESNNPALPEVTYYCKLCDSPCASISIMMHLTGFKHLLRFFETVEERLYNKFRYASKKVVESRVMDYLANYEKKYGRGTIQVQKEVVEEAPRESQPGPSWRNDNPGVDMDFEDLDITSIEDLDTSQNDYHCIVCDAHMNNKSMWESHVRGKRHLKNKKKYPGESSSKVRSVACPGEIAHLEHKLQDEMSPIVGLEYIRETQGDAGNMYNCFLCGACNSEYDIIDHILTPKHRTKYLESQLKKGKMNCIEDIKCLHDVSQFYKDSLIEEECRRIVEEYGSGKVEVYKSKVVYPYGSYY